MATRLERLLRMYDLISRGHTCTVDDFCRMFEVQSRTVYEDVRMLKEMMHADIEYDRYKNSYVNKTPHKKLPTFDLNEGEVLALTIGRDMLAEYTGTALEPILKSALDKICDRLPDRTKVDLEDLQSVVQFRSESFVRISHKSFFDFRRACDKHLLADITYYAASKDELSQRTIEPYRLLENRGTWYLVAYCRSRNDLRLFALHRVRDYKILDGKFEARNLDIDAWVNRAFQLEHGEQEMLFRIKFDPIAARYIRERTWHSSQKLIENPDGSCVLEFHSSSVDEVKRWVLTYGAQAEALEPQELRTKIEEELNKALSLYRQPTTPR